MLSRLVVSNVPVGRFRGATFTIANSEDSEELLLIIKGFLLVYRGILVAKSYRCFRRLARINRVIVKSIVR